MQDYNEKQQVQQEKIENLHFGKKKKKGGPESLMLHSRCVLKWRL